MTSYGRHYAARRVYMKTSFLTREELLAIGFASVGENVFISKNASFYSPEKITIGDNVRIDDFCILSGKINLGSFIHISAYSGIYAAAGVSVGDFVAISIKTTIVSVTENLSGEYFACGPVVPEEFRGVRSSPVTLEKHSFLGAHSLMLPGTTLQEGSAMGAYSLWLKGKTEPWKIYAGIPAKVIKCRSENVKLLEEEMRKKLNET